MQTPLLSIIMPCYNLGTYIREAVNSVQKLPATLYELIIVDDGSPDPATQQVIKELKEEGFYVVQQENQELAHTLNNGIMLSAGKYILVLSADDMLEAKGVINSVEYLETHPDIDIVYGDALKFGSESGLWKVGNYNLQKLMLESYIHASAVYRKKVWETNHGYDANAPYMGLEDWDFWLNSSFNGFRFHYLEEVVLHYRILPNSKIRMLKKNRQRSNELVSYIMNKYHGKLGNKELEDIQIRKFKQQPLGIIVKWVLKAYFPKTFDKLAQKGYIRNTL
jgi:glycosyltransferase involved in cell wall biosynthesis